MKKEKILMGQSPIQCVLGDKVKIKEAVSNPSTSGK